MVFIHQPVSSDNLFSSLMWYHTYEKFLHLESTEVNCSAREPLTLHKLLTGICIVRIIFMCEYYVNDFYAKYKINLLETIVILPFWIPAGCCVSQEKSFLNSVHKSTHPFAVFTIENSSSV
jgi:hypothetical protein